MSNFRLDICLSQTKFFLQPDLIEVFQILLKEMLPSWCEKLHSAIDPGESPVIVPLDKPDALFKLLTFSVNEKGALYKLLARNQPQPERCHGIVELWGKGHSLNIIVGIDERPIHRRGLTWGFGNDLTLQICNKKIEGEPSTAWARKMFRRLVEIFNPQHGYAYLQKEYYSKNISREGGGMMAIGRDIAKYLPGIYWLNFFGAEYSSLIGESILLTAPTFQSEKVADGIFLALDEDPEAWETEAYRDREKAILDHVGREYFFLRDSLDRTTKAPDFGIPDI